MNFILHFKRMKLLRHGLLLLAAALLPSLARASFNLDYYQAGSNMWYCASTGTMTTQAGVSASSPTLSLWNPSTSTIRGIIKEVGIDVTAAPAANVAYFLAYSTAPQSMITMGGSTPTITSAMVGLATTTVGVPTLVCLQQGVMLGTPKAFRFIGGVSGASTTAPYVLTDNTNNNVVVPPGGMISIQATAASAVQAHILWLEAPQ